MSYEQDSAEMTHHKNAKKKYSEAKPYANDYM